MKPLKKWLCFGIATMTVIMLCPMSALVANQSAVAHQKRYPILNDDFAVPEPATGGSLKVPGLANGFVQQALCILSRGIFI